MYYAEVESAGPDLHFEVIYDVVRHERLTLGIARPRLAEVELKDRDRKEYLQPDKLVPVTGLPSEFAASSPREKLLRSQKRGLSTITFLPPCVTTRPAPAGDAAMSFTPVTPRKVTAPISIPLFIAMARSQGIPRTLRNSILPAAGQTFGRDRRLSLLVGFLRTTTRMGPGGYF